MKQIKLFPSILTIYVFAVFAVVSCITVIPVPAEEKQEQVIKVMAKTFEYFPANVKVKAGTPVVLELTSLDKVHGFHCPTLHLRADIFPRKTTRVRFIPDKAGVFPFHCDVFCGSGHEDMTGIITVEN